MLKEFVDAIKQLAENAATPRLLNVPGAPGHVRYFINGEGQLETTTIPPDAPSDTIRSIESLIDYAEAESDVGVIFYDRNGITFFCDPTERRDRACFPLSYSRPFKTLQELDARPRNLGQKDFLRLLRFDLSCCPHAAQLVSAIRQVHFRSSTETKGEVQKGKASLGRAIEAELTGAEKLPDTIPVVAPVWNELPFLATVACLVDVDSQAETFSLTPLPQAIEKAVRDGEDKIRAVLADQADKHNARVYYGHP